MDPPVLVLKHVEASALAFGVMIILMILPTKYLPSFHQVLAPERPRWPRQEDPPAAAPRSGSCKDLRSTKAPQAQGPSWAIEGVTPLDHFSDVIWCLIRSKSHLGYVHTSIHPYIHTTPHTSPQAPPQGGMGGGGVARAGTHTHIYIYTYYISMTCI